MILICCIRRNPYITLQFIYKKEGKMFLALFFFLIFVIYNKFSKFLKDLANISLTLKILIPKN